MYHEEYLQVTQTKIKGKKGKILKEAKRILALALNSSD
jgi:hypothetical protein